MVEQQNGERRRREEYDLPSAGAGFSSPVKTPYTNDIKHGISVSWKRERNRRGMVPPGGRVLVRLRSVLLPKVRLGKKVNSEVEG